jgi:hypothetical protein
MTTLTLKMPRRLESPNTWNGRHWSVKHQISQEWEAHLVWASWTQAGDYRRMALDAPKRRRVTVERQVPSGRNFIRDDDNLVFSTKPLRDALVRQGLIHDDSRKWLEHPTPTQSVSADGNDYTIVVIESCCG